MVAKNGEGWEGGRTIKMSGEMCEAEPQGEAAYFNCGESVGLKGTRIVPSNS